MAEGVVVFDLDGTLLRDASATSLLASRFGDAELVERVQRRYRDGACTNAAVVDAAASIFRGREVEEIARTLATGRWISGIDDVLDELRRTGAFILLATVGWEFVAEIVAVRHGFDAWCGTRMHRRGSRLTGRAGRPMEGADKAAFVRRFCDAHAISLTRVAAVGDSRSDLPLFAVAGTSIALNADQEARVRAARAMDTEDLRDLLPALRAHLGPVARPDRIDIRSR